MTLLAVEALEKAFGGVTAVDGVSFALEPGRILALIGPNGAGKSTCFNIINGQLAPDRGRVLIMGREATGWPPRRIARLGVGRTFQITAIVGSMSVRENVQLGLIAREGRHLSLLSRGDRLHRDAAQALLERVGIAEHADRASGLLAYGDLKRVELAVALAGRPRLLLMDEPTAGMAPADRRAQMALIAELAREEEIGVLFTEHDMDVVFAHAERVMVLDRGRLIAQGTPPEVRANPEVRAVYLGEPEAPA